eukprot:4061223-Pleurochrysis_carterae.AAC.1
MPTCRDGRSKRCWLQCALECADFAAANFFLPSFDTSAFIDSQSSCAAVYSSTVAKGRHLHIRQRRGSRSLGRAVWASSYITGIVGK